MKNGQLSKIILAILCCLILTACGNLLDPVQDDPRFESIKKQFVSDAKLFGVKPDMENIRIAFGDVEKDLDYAGFITLSKGDGSNPDGYCTVLKAKSGLGKPVSKLALGKKYNMKVIIISSRYKNASLEFLETLVYHELGHCTLGYSHRPNSVMSSEIEFMGTSRYFWLKELFTRAPMDYNLVVRKVDFVASELKPVYSVNYYGFNENLIQDLYFDKDLQLYFSIDNLGQGQIR